LSFSDVRHFTRMSRKVPVVDKKKQFVVVTHVQSVHHQLECVIAVLLNLYTTLLFKSCDNSSHINCRI